MDEVLPCLANSTSPAGLVLSFYTAPLAPSQAFVIRVAVKKFRHSVFSKIPSIWIDIVKVLFSNAQVVSVH